MGRPRSFSMDEVLDAGVGAFVRGGYEGTSIDDLVTALNMHRGSLYQAFGSKRGFFLAVLAHDIETHLVSDSSIAPIPSGAPQGGAAHGPDLDLLLIAAVERGHRDPEVAALVRRGFQLLDEEIADPDATPQSSGERRPKRAVQLLADRLYDRLLLDTEQPSTPPQLTTQEK